MIEKVVTSSSERTVLCDFSVKADVQNSSEAIVTGVTTPSGGVAHALGPQWWIEYKTL